MIELKPRRNYIFRLKEKSADVCNHMEDMIFDLVKEEIGVTREEIRGRGRDRDLAIARKVIVNLLANYHNVHEDISGLFINRDRTTSIYYMKQFLDDYKYDRLFRTAYDKILFRTEFINNKNITPYEYKERLEKENKYLQEKIEGLGAKVEELESKIREIKGTQQPCLS